MLQEGSRGGDGGVGRRDKERDTSGMTEGWGGLEMRGNSEPNFLPPGASTFHSIVFFSPPSNELCQSQSIAQMKLWASSLEKIRGYCTHSPAKFVIRVFAKIATVLFSWFRVV